MKLAAHYNKASIIITISVLMAGAIIYFFTINYIAQKQFDNDLAEEVSEVLEYVNFHQQLPKPADFDEDRTSFTKTNVNQFNTRFFDTVYTIPKTIKPQAGRAVETLIPFKGDHYKVVIIISKESTQYLVQIIALITLLLMVSLLVILFLTNRFILKGLWKPFYNTLHQIKAFNISDALKLDIKPNNVDEFNELNDAVTEMSGRAKSDFQNLKQFTENASHEMLTPLAVITTKLDTLIQDETLSADQLDHINDIYASLNKSTRLNQSLLLLVKLDNNLIKDDEAINLDDAIIAKATQFQELLSNQNIRLTYQLTHKQIIASKYLVDILLNNLFSNAVKHNYQDGQIIISLTQNELVIKNTGNQIQLNNNNIFDRFAKGHDSHGTGLGLALVKTICTYYKFDINYSYQAYWHVFTVNFNAK